jgi:adenosylcobinamide-GDP ribazoletransferase
VTQLVSLFLVAVAFLTRLPVPRTIQNAPDSLARSVAFFPLVGLLVSVGAVILNHVFSRYVPHDVVVVIILVFLVVITGGLHEDALADAADGFGGGWEKDRILSIMRDSRTGSFGALAIALGLLVRFVFMTNLPIEMFDRYLIAGQVTSRWTTLPLAFFLPPAREGSGHGVLVASKVTGFSLVMGTIFAVAILGAALGTKALWPFLAAIAITAASGAYYHRRIGGITGDCLGATNQIAEMVVYLAGVILR